MKNVFKFVLLLAFAVSAFAWTGCSKDDKKSGGGSSSIIGTWETTDENGNVIKMDFKSGGQYISYYYVNNDLAAAVKGEFSYTATELTTEWSSGWDVDYHDSNNNRFPDAEEFTTIPSDEEKGSYIISGNKLTIKDSDTSEEIVYTRTTSPQPTTPTNPPATSPLIGTWEIEDQYGTETYEFLNNGQFITYSTDKQGVIRTADRGTFSYNSLTINMKGEQYWYASYDNNGNEKPDPDEFKDGTYIPVTLKYKLTNSNNSLELDDQKGSKVTYKRAVK
jgi:hypothetical protein